MSPLLFNLGTKDLTKDIDEFCAMYFDDLAIVVNDKTRLDDLDEKIRLRVTRMGGSLNYSPGKTHLMEIVGVSTQVGHI